MIDDSRFLQSSTAVLDQKKNALIDDSSLLATAPVPTHDASDNLLQDFAGNVNKAASEFDKPTWLEQKTTTNPLLRPALRPLGELVDIPVGLAKLGRTAFNAIPTETFGDKPTPQEAQQERVAQQQLNQVKDTIVPSMSAPYAHPVSGLIHKPVTTVLSWLPVVGSGLKLASGLADMGKVGEVAGAASKVEPVVETAQNVESATTPIDDSHLLPKAPAPKEGVKLTEPELRASIPQSQPKSVLDVIQNTLATRNKEMKYDDIPPIVKYKDNALGKFARTFDSIFNREYGVGKGAVFLLDRTPAINKASDKMMLEFADDLDKEMSPEEGVAIQNALLYPKNPVDYAIKDKADQFRAIYNWGIGILKKANPDVVERPDYSPGVYYKQTRKGVGDMSAGSKPSIGSGHMQAKTFDYPSEAKEAGYLPVEDERIKMITYIRDVVRVKNTLDMLESMKKLPEDLLVRVKRGSEMPEGYRTFKSGDLRDYSINLGKYFRDVENRGGGNIETYNWVAKKELAGLVENYVKRSEPNIISDAWNSLNKGLTSLIFYNVFRHPQNMLNNFIQEGSALTKGGRWFNKAIGDIKDQSGYWAEAQDYGGFHHGFSDEVPFTDRVIELMEGKQPESILKKLTGMLNPIEDIKSFYKMNANAVWATDEFLKYSIYKALREKGMAPVNAMDRTNKFMINYGDVTSAEKGITNFFMFYPWMKGNAKLLSAMGTHPIAYRAELARTLMLYGAMHGLRLAASNATGEQANTPLFGSIHVAEQLGRPFWRAFEEGSKAADEGDELPDIAEKSTWGFGKGAASTVRSHLRPLAREVVDWIAKPNEPLTEHARNLLSPISKSGAFGVILDAAQQGDEAAISLTKGMLNFFGGITFKREE